MSRLTLLHINIIGVVVALIVAVALYFTLVTNGQEEIKTNQTKYDGVKARADKLNAADKALKTALAEEAKTKSEYAVYQGQYMARLAQPNNRTVAMVRTWWPNGGRSFPERFINGVNRYMAGQVKKYGLVWENKGVVVLPAYGPDPNAIDMGDNGYLTFGPYQMIVRGKSFQSLLNHYQDWNSMRNLGVPVADGLSVSGNSPNLIATYNVTFTSIIDEPIPPKDIRIGAGSGGSGGGAGGGPGGGGFGGGPGMGGGSGGMGSGGMGSGGMMGGGARRGGSIPAN